MAPCTLWEQSANGILPKNVATSGASTEFRSLNLQLRLEMDVTPSPTKTCMDVMGIFTTYWRRRADMKKKGVDEYPAYGSEKLAETVPLQKTPARMASYTTIYIGGYYALFQKIFWKTFDAGIWRKESKRRLADSFSCNREDTTP